jgi:hypothetical protein
MRTGTFLVRGSYFKYFRRLTPLICCRITSVMTIRGSGS